MAPVFSEDAPRANWVHNPLESNGDTTAMIPFRRVSLFSAALLVAASCTVQVDGVLKLEFVWWTVSGLPSYHPLAVPWIGGDRC
jgi:hypothetical protein